MVHHLRMTPSADAPGAALLDTEWLLTTGTGSYAAGSVVGVNTRKYHGLLVAAVRPPAERAVLLSNLFQEIQLGEQTMPLSCFEFAGAFAPRGDQTLTEFSLDKAAGCVTFTHRLTGRTLLVRRIALARGSNAVTVRYELRNLPRGLARSQCRLRIAPFLAYRHYHGNRGAGAGPAVVAEWAGPAIRLRDPAGALSALRIAMPEGGQFDAAADWWYRFFYRAEAERGENPWEDLFTPGRFILPFAADGSAEFRVAAEPAEPIAFAQIVAAQQAHHDQLLAGAGAAVPAELNDLVLAGDDFIVSGPAAAAASPSAGGTGQGGCASILAGFPWFADWGRDAFISLPGLLLTTSRFDLALGVLRRFAGAIRNGLVPNRFSDEPGAPSVGCDYNSVDAGLWLIHAAFAWADATGDLATLDRDLLDPVVQILDAYQRGTDFDIHVDADGLLSAGRPDTQVTWMDAMVTLGQPITPRAGKPVEVNALFGHALGRLAGRLEALGRPAAAEYRARRECWSAGFAAAFPNRRDGGLFDVIGLDGRPDARVRPNQLFAVSLGDCPLPEKVQRQVVRIAAGRLLTPVGLRTLAPGEPGYCPRCTGSREQRDGAYHQGTVWPWLIGPMVEAHLRVNAFSAAAKRQARAWLAPLRAHLTAAGCVGQVSEIFDADPPHTPRGTFAQAWSVAELLRAAMMVAEESGF